MSKKVSDKKTVDINEVDNNRDVANYIKTFDKVPLEQNQFGHLLNDVKRFLNVSDSEKSNHYLRFGVENNRKQSFISSMAVLHALKTAIDTRPSNVRKNNEGKEETSKEIDFKDAVKKIKSIRQFKKCIIDMISIDEYASYQNGDLNVMFYDKKRIVSKRELSKYKSSKFHLEKPHENVYVKLVSSYINFLDHLKSDTTIINHTHMWDIMTKSIFKDPFNLIIIEYDNNNNNINLVCPANHYSDQFERFNIKNESIVLLKNKEFYEPLVYYNKAPGGNFDYKYKVTIGKEKPLDKFLNNVSNLYTNMVFCGVQPSITDSQYPYEYIYNTSKFVLDKLNDNKIPIKYQVVDNSQKNVGFIVSFNGLDIYLPHYPTRIIHDDKLKMVYIYDESFMKYVHSYDNTKTIFNKIYEITKKEIPCGIKSKLISDDSVVGIYTISNDFAKTLKSKNTDNLYISNNIPLQKDGTYIDPQDVNKTIANFKLDVGVDNDMSKLSKNNKLYEIFKYHVLILLSHMKHRNILNRIHVIANTYIKVYVQQHVEINKLLSDLCSKNITFMTDMSNDSIDKILTNTWCTENCLDFKLTLPKYHLLNQTSNENGFYEKLSDEFIRYRQLNTFYKIPKQYIMHTINDYNLSNDEILTFQSFLTSDRLNSNQSSDIKLYNDNLNLSYPAKSIKYSNEVFDDKILENVVSYHDQGIKVNTVNTVNKVNK